jgi:hypothetical protein
MKLGDTKLGDRICWEGNIGRVIAKHHYIRPNTVAIAWDKVDHHLLKTGFGVDSRVWVGCWRDIHPFNDDPNCKNRSFISGDEECTVVDTQSSVVEKPINISELEVGDRVLYDDHIEATVIGTCWGARSVLLGTKSNEDGKLLMHGGRTPQEWHDIGWKAVLHSSADFDTYEVATSEQIKLIPTDNPEQQPGSSVEEVKLEDITLSSVKEIKLGDAVLLYLNKHGMISDKPTSKTITATVIAVGNTIHNRRRVKVGWKSGERRCKGASINVVGSPYHPIKVPGTHKYCQVENYDEYIRAIGITDKNAFQIIKSNQESMNENAEDGMTVQAKIRTLLKPGDKIILSKGSPSNRYAGYKFEEDTTATVMAVGLAEYLVGFKRPIIPGLDGRHVKTYWEGIGWKDVIDNTETFEYFSALRQEDTNIGYDTTLDQCEIGDRILLYLNEDNSLSSVATDKVVEGCLFNAPKNSTFFQFAWKGDVVKPAKFLGTLMDQTCNDWFGTPNQYTNFGTFDTKEASQSKVRVIGKCAMTKPEEKTKPPKEEEVKPMIEIKETKIGEIVRIYYDSLGRKMGGRTPNWVEYTVLSQTQKGTTIVGRRDKPVLLDGKSPALTIESSNKQKLTQQGCCSVIKNPEEYKYRSYCLTEQKCEIVGVDSTAIVGTILKSIRVFLDSDQEISKTKTDSMFETTAHFIDDRMLIEWKAAGSAKTFAEIDNDTAHEFIVEGTRLTEFKLGDKIRVYTDENGDLSNEKTQYSTVGIIGGLKNRRAGQSKSIQIISKTHTSNFNWASYGANFSPETGAYERYTSDVMDFTVYNTIHDTTYTELIERGKDEEWKPAKKSVVNKRTTLKDTKVGDQINIFSVMLGDMSAHACDVCDVKVEAEVIARKPDGKIRVAWKDTCQHDYWMLEDTDKLLDRGFKYAINLTENYECEIISTIPKNNTANNAILSFNDARVGDMVSFRVKSDGGWVAYNNDWMKPVEETIDVEVIHIDDLGVVIGWNDKPEHMSVANHECCSSSCDPSLFDRHSHAWRFPKSLKPMISKITRPWFKISDFKPGDTIGVYKAGDGSKFIGGRDHSGKEIVEVDIIEVKDDMLMIGWNDETAFPATNGTIEQYLENGHMDGVDYSGYKYAWRIPCTCVAYIKPGKTACKQKAPNDKPIETADDKQVAEMKIEEFKSLDEFGNELPKQEIAEAPIEEPEEKKTDLAPLGMLAAALIGGFVKAVEDAKKIGSVRVDPSVPNAIEEVSTDQTESVV